MDIFEFLTILIALMAAFTSFYSAFVLTDSFQKNHFPILIVEYNTYKSEYNEGKFNGMVLKNVGTGPAIIKERDIRFNGRQLGTQDFKDYIFDFRAKFLEINSAQEESSVIGIATNFLDEGYVISPGDSMLIFGISVDDRHVATTQLNLLFYLQTRYYIQYKDIFGKYNFVKSKKYEEIFSKYFDSSSLKDKYREMI